MSRVITSRNVGAGEFNGDIGCTQRWLSVSLIGLCGDNNSSCDVPFFRLGLNDVFLSI